MENNERKPRIMPYNVDAERSVLGAMLIDGEVATKCCGVLKTEDFYLEANQNIFNAIYNLSVSNKPVDAIAVEDMLSQVGKLESSGGLEYILDLSNYVPSSASYEYYLEILKRTSLSRTIIRRATDIINKAYNEPDSQVALEYAENQIFGISKDRESSTLEHIKSSADEVIKEINDACKGVYKGGTMTGFKHFDNLTNGIKPSELILLAARPSVGKTAFALNVATNVALNGGNVAIFSLEMPAKQVTARILASVSKVNINAGIKNGFNNNPTGQIMQIMAGYNELIKSNIYIDDSSVTKPMDIRSKCMRLIREFGKLDIIVVDYLQLMTSDRKTDSRQNEVAELSRSMKILANELQCPILLLSQLSRAIDQRTDHTPKLSDLRESGAIEQDADMVLFLDKPYLNDKNMPEDDVKIVVAKHRNGELATLQLKWTGAIMKFDAVLDNRPVVHEEIEPPKAETIDTLKQVETDSPFQENLKPIDDAPFDTENAEDSPFVDDGIATEVIEKADNGNAEDTDEIVLGDMFYGSEEDNGELGY